MASPRVFFVAAANFADFEKQLAEVKEAADKRLIRPTLILPPILNEGENTNTYLSGLSTDSKQPSCVYGIIIMIIMNL